jgi:hypothetical protein
MNVEIGVAMSMIGNFAMASDSEIDRLLAKPATIMAFLEPRMSTPGAMLDVDKAWHGIHWLLSGSAWEGDWPLGFIVTGGTAIGDEDVGYGPARALRSAEVLELNTALAKVSRDELKERFDPEELTKAEIYPQIWDEGDEALDYLLGGFDDLKKYVAEAAAKKMGMLVWIG